MKLMRKLEKQALARAAKEARKQQGKHFKMNIKTMVSLVLCGQLSNLNNSELFIKNTRASGCTAS